MDTHGDRGALDLNTVKNFTWQLLNVRTCRVTFVTLAFMLSSHKYQGGADPYRALPSVTTTESSTAISSLRTC